MSKGLILVISGGQTGADRGALDAARQVGILIGGWCPYGRRAEDGTVPLHLGLQEIRGGYRERTECNVVSSHATLLVHMGKLGPGSRLTMELANKHGRPLFAGCDLRDTRTAADRTAVWLGSMVETFGFGLVLNVAGPRESTNPGLQVLTFDTLCPIFARYRLNPQE